MLALTTVLAATTHLPASSLLRPAVVVPTRAAVPHMQQQEQQERRFALPFLQPNVPDDQQPTEELRIVRKQPFLDWADDDSFGQKLGGLYQNIMLFAALPISYTTFYNIPDELPNLLVAANLGTLPVMIAFVLRLRFNWGYASKRLLSRSTYYEANQRGYEAEKGKADLMRDKLVQKSQVAPIIKRIDSALAGLFLASVLSLGSAEALVAFQGDAGPATLKSLSGDEARRFDNRLKGDNDFAAEQQRRAQSRGEENTKPVYCDSRYYKILAGGNGQGGVGCS